MNEEALYSAGLKLAWTGIKSTAKKWFRGRPKSIAEIKKITQVLIIDDEQQNSLLQNISDAGWNAKWKTDVTDLDVEWLKTADIIFVDYKNVGAKLTPTDEGIGLMKLLRRKYPEKHLIFFSGYAGFIPGHEFHDIANGWIQKNADPYVYIERIEAAALKKYGAG